MQIVVVGVNHRSAPLDLRERLAFSREELPQVFERLRLEVGLLETTVLSTCNRIEIYATVPMLDGALERLTDFLSRHGRVERQLLGSRLYGYTQPQSIQHLFAVASGLDSMILGEHEILCQVKHAYERARVLGATGKALNVLFQRAINAAKAVRTQTAIGAGSVSIGSVAVDLAEKIFGELSAQVVLLVGAGSTGELALKRLVDRGVRQVRLANRSVERAQLLAQRYGGAPIALGGLEEELSRADIVITALGGGGRLLERSQIVRAMHRRRQRPLCLIDLGMPRNLDPAAASVENVYLFNVDNLEALVSGILLERGAAMEHSRKIIDQKVGQFMAWFNQELNPIALAQPTVNS